MVRKCQNIGPNKTICKASYPVTNRYDTVQMQMVHKNIN